MKFIGLLVSLYKFASPTNLFKYFRRRYDKQIVQELNKVLKLKGRCIRAAENVSFLRKCLRWYVAPRHISRRVRRCRPKAPWGIERAFMKDEINKERDILEYSAREYRQKLAYVSKKLQLFDRIRFCKFINKTCIRQLERLQKKNERIFDLIYSRKNGNGTIQHSTIINLAGVELRDVERDILCRGLRFGIPPKLNKEAVQAEFEVFYQQLLSSTPISKDKEQECRAALSEIAHRFIKSRVDKTGYPVNVDHLRAIRELKNNKSIVITHPDKGNGVVILSKDDYVAKMKPILDDTSKFRKIGDANENDRTLLQERALQAYLLRAHKNKQLTREVYNRVRPVGSTRPRMYGVPKLHKEGVPLRPILSMINSPQHELAKWLTEVLRPVLSKYSQHTVRDTFEFCDMLEKFNEKHRGQSFQNLFMCSFDIKSLFTNVPLRETIDICMLALYQDEDVTKPSVPETLFRKLLVKATTEVEFSFDSVMYAQVDGVAMGSPLGPTLANIFVGYMETKIPVSEFPLLYHRFVDDTFAIFEGNTSAVEFFDKLNGLHPNLQFTMESENEGKLPFMDVEVKKMGAELRRTVYRKPSFTGLYTRWDSFCPKLQKINIIKCLSQRAMKICSPQELETELSKLRVIFRNNGYPDSVIEETLTIVTERGRKVDKEDNCRTDRAVLRLPWIGMLSNKFKKEIVHATTAAYQTVQPVVFTTRYAFSGVAKDVLPMTSQSCLIYQYQCCCEQQYVGKTTQRLIERIKQHVPNKLLTGKDVKEEKNDSGIAKHVKANTDCLPTTEAQLVNRFCVLAQARNQGHLDILEAVFIRKLAPALCQQKNLKALHLI